MSHKGTLKDDNMTDIRGTLCTVFKSLIPNFLKPELTDEQVFKLYKDLEFVDMNEVINGQSDDSKTTITNE